MREVLAELKTVYKKYFELTQEPLWLCWLMEYQNIFDDTELYILEVHQQNNFVFDIEHSAQFYYRKSILLSLTNKLYGIVERFLFFANEWFEETVSNLKNTFLLYSHTWDVWITDCRCFLNTAEIQFIERLKYLDFDFGGVLKEFSFKDLPLCQQIGCKLTINYSDFQCWVMNKFRGAILWRSFNQPGNSLLETCTVEVKISQVLNDSFEKFHINNIGAILHIDEETLLLSPKLFEKILLSQAILTREDIALQHIRGKEGAMN